MNARKAIAWVGVKFHTSLYSILGILNFAIGGSLKAGDEKIIGVLDVLNFNHIPAISSLNGGSSGSRLSHVARTLDVQSKTSGGQA